MKTEIIKRYKFHTCVRGRAMMNIPIFIMVTIYAATAIAQNPGLTLLKKKTERRIQDWVDSSQAITGLAAVDLTSGETISFNENMVFTQASAIKIPILMEVYKQAHQQKFSLTDLRRIASVAGGSGILKDMADTPSLSIRNLCVLMMALSDNTATNSLIDLVGMDAVNASLQLMGLKNTRLRRRMIDAAASGRGQENVSTPAEAVKILQMLYKGEFIDKATSSAVLSIMKAGREGSRLAKGIAPAVPIVYKPGSLRGVSTEWAIIKLPERPYAVAIMQNYMIEGQEDMVIEKISGCLYNYFWRLGNASQYGTYVDPAMKR